MTANIGLGPPLGPRGPDKMHSITVHGTSLAIQYAIKIFIAPHTLNGCEVLL